MTTVAIILPREFLATEYLVVYTSGILLLYCCCTRETDIWLIGENAHSLLLGLRRDGRRRTSRKPS